MTSTVSVDRIVHGDFFEAGKISILTKEHDIVIFMVRTIVRSYCCWP